MADDATTRKDDEPLAGADDVVARAIEEGLPVLKMDEARPRLGEFVNAARFGGSRFVLGQYGTPSAALVPLEDLARLLLWEAERQVA